MLLACVVEIIVTSGFSWSHGFYCYYLSAGFMLAHSGNG